MKLNNIILIAILLCGLVITPVVATSEQVFFNATKGGVFNGGMNGSGSTSSNSWIGSESYGWAGYISSGSVMYDANTSHTGSTSINITSTSGTGGSLVLATNFVPFNYGDTRYAIPVKPNTVYKLTGWMRISNIVGVTGAQLAAYETNGASYVLTDIISSPSYINGTTAWTQYSTTITTSPTTNMMQVYGYINEATGTIWIDDLSVEEVHTETYAGTPGRAYPVIQGNTSTDNIDQALDSGWAAANTYALTNAVNEGATHIKTFTPTKSQITNISIYTTATGTAVTWTLVIHDASNNIKSSYTWTPSATGVQYIPVPALWSSGNYHFHVYASATTGTPTLKSGTPNDLETGSYIQYYAKNTESVNIAVNGNTTMLDTGDAFGLLSGAMVNTYNGTYTWNGDSISKVASAISNATHSNAPVSYGDLAINGYWYSVENSTIIFDGTQPTTLPMELTYKVNTIVPINSGSITTTSFHRAPYTGSINVSVSSDAITWKNIYDNIDTPGTNYYSTNTSDVSDLKGNTTFYIRIKKGSTESYLSTGIQSINLALNTTSTNNTFLAWQTGTNTVNISSNGQAVSSSLDPSLMVNVILYKIDTTVLPIVQWITDKTTVMFPSRIKVNDTSLNVPLWWNYSMGDGSLNNVSSINLKNFSYQYVKRGLWSLCLDTANSAGHNQTCKQIRVIGYM